MEEADLPDVFIAVTNMGDVAHPEGEALQLDPLLALPRRWLPAASLGFLCLRFDIFGH